MMNKAKLLGLVILITFMVIPFKKVFYFPAESRRIGPIGLSPQLENGSKKTFGAGSKPLSSDVEIRSSFLVYSRPAEYSVILSTGLNFPEGIAVTLDKYGNLYLQIESLGIDDYQLLPISGPVEFNRWQNLRLSIRKGSGELKINFNGNAVMPVEARDGKSVNINQMNLRTNAISLSGVGLHQFNGEIKNTTFILGVSTGSLDPKLIRLLLAILGLWVTYNVVRQKNERLMRLNN